jgi:WD40 repeat protein
VISVAFSSDGRLCATGSMDATVRVWTVATGALVHVLEGPGAEIEVRRRHRRRQFSTLAWSPHESTMSNVP